MSHPPKPVPEDEEIDEEFEEEFDDDMDDGPDMFEALGTLLATEDGETITTVIVSLKDATEKIALGIEMQNKILVKIMSELKNLKCGCASAPTA